jgi:hypothetical protein
MIVSLREGSFAVTPFTEHTYPPIKELGRRRYYRSHRKTLITPCEFLRSEGAQDLKRNAILFQIPAPFAPEKLSGGD